MYIILSKYRECKDRKPSILGLELSRGGHVVTKQLNQHIEAFEHFPPPACPTVAIIDAKGCRILTLQTSKGQKETQHLDSAENQEGFSFFWLFL